MDRLTSDGFVISVSYNVSATDGSHSVSTHGLVNFAKEPDKAYIPYADLTEVEVVGWVQNLLNGEDEATLQTQIESTLQTQLNVLKIPVKQSGLPWNS